MKGSPTIQTRSASDRGGAGRHGPAPGPPESSDAVRPGTYRRRHDNMFRLLVRGSGILVLLLVIAVAAFLISEAIPAIAADRSNFLTTLAWDPDTQKIFGIAALAFGSVLTSVLALVMGVPVAVGVALFISHYVPRRLAGTLAAVVDLLAAVPSVVFGLWGLVYLVPNLVPLSKFLNHNFSWIPLFAMNQQIFGKSFFAASIVLAVMVLPIVAAISREVFLQTPKEQMEAALALGATKWEMVRMTVLPHGRSGVISAIVLGFGRAIGETIAVALVLSSVDKVSFHILEPAGNTIAANVANLFQDAGQIGRGALIASGLVLFAITLVVNFGARWIARGSREQS
ncbi:MAG: phosphate ABC transporter permease subunit PstC [Sciscionella sp.]